MVARPSYEQLRLGYFRFFRLVVVCIAWVRNVAGETRLRRGFKLLSIHVGAKILDCGLRFFIHSLAFEVDEHEFARLDLRMR